MAKVKPVTLLIFLYIICLSEGIPVPFEYGFVVDAGSSGTRIYAYRWESRIATVAPNEPGSATAQNQFIKSPQSRPQEITPEHVEDDNYNKIEKMADINTQTEASEFVKKLVNIANTYYIPKIGAEIGATISDEQKKKMPIYLKATAGMRLLPRQKRENILNKLTLSLTNRDPNTPDLIINPFQFKPEYLFISSGTEEAIYDWLSVNYLKDTLNKEDVRETYGALDLGGASTQIAFTPYPQSDILNNVALVRPFDREFRLYAVSHLGYGADQMERQIAKKVEEQSVNLQIARRHVNARNPCLFSGDTKAYKINLQQKTQSGSGIYADCKEKVQKVLNLDNKVCQQFYKKKGCSINGIYIPPIPENMKWIAFSSFYHTIASGLPNDQGNGIISANDMTLNQIEAGTQRLCEKEWSDVKTLYHPGTKPKYLRTLCLRFVYVVTLLTDGYHFDRDINNIDFRERSERRENGWQWGSILYDANLLPYKYNDITISHAESEYDDYLDDYLDDYVVAESGVYDGQTRLTYLTYYWLLILFAIMTTLALGCIYGSIITAGFYLVVSYCKTKKIQNNREYESV